MKLNWLDLERLFLNGRWSELADASHRYLAKHEADAPVQVFTMYSHALSKTGRRREVAGILKLGIRRYPKEPLCYAVLGSHLATISTADPELRREAIAFWRKAMELQKGTFEATFDYLAEEIDVLEKLAPEAPYPTVGPVIRGVVDDLKDGGLFAEWSSEEVVQSIIDDLGAGDVRHARRKSIDYRGLLGLDKKRCYTSDWRFSAKEVLERLSAISETRGISIVCMDESEVSKEGERNVEFAVGSAKWRGRVSDVSSLVVPVNRCLLRLESSRVFYEVDKGQEPELFTFLFVAEGEASRLRKLRLFELDLP